jgi:hypothetical protein
VLNADFVTGDCGRALRSTCTGNRTNAGTINVPRQATALTAGLRRAADSIVARFFSRHVVVYHSVAGQGGSDDALAVDEFLLGEDAYHHDEYRLAERHYRNALDRDRDFAIAGWHLLFARRALRETSDSEIRDASTVRGRCSRRSTVTCWM